MSLAIIPDAVLAEVTALRLNLFSSSDLRLNIRPAQDSFRKEPLPTAVGWLGCVPASSAADSHPTGLWMYPTQLSREAVSSRVAALVPHPLSKEASNIPYGPC